MSEHLPALPALPALYDELADWYPLLTAPPDYAGEAALFRDHLARALPGARTLLELGSGAGANASHLKRHYACTLVDISPRMLDLSRRLNPECEHAAGDMRSVRLGRSFDAVFVHDAVMYLTTEPDLRRAVETVFAHTREGGAALFVPDCVAETFVPGTDHGGHDGEGRALRYLEWIWDPDPADTVAIADYVYLLREGDAVRAIQDRHTFGLFPRATWLRLLHEAGFALHTHAPAAPDVHGEIFLVTRPGG